nr:hypothetical protein [Tanacetum cinerariifolium]
MNYEPIVAGTHVNGFPCTKTSDNAGQARKEIKPIKDYILLQLWTADPLFSQNLKSSYDDGFKPSNDDGKKVDEDQSKGNECNDQEKEDNVNNANNVNTVSSTINVAVTNKDNELPFDPNMPGLENVGTFNISNEDEDDDIVVDMNNMDTTIQISAIGELTFFLGLKVKKKNDGIFISQDKYVAEILKNFGFTEVKNASTTMKTQKHLLKDEDGKEVDVHIYRYQVNLKVSHLHDVKRIFSDYARASLDRKSTIGGYQYRRCRLISCQCKKQTVVANSTIEAEYVAASSCCG